jgi:opacity protein-like surface antigen
MFGARLKISVLAIAPLLAGASAQAADYNYPPPPQPYYPPPQQVIIQQPAPEFAGNWYLRGQIGMGVSGSYDLSISNIPATGMIDSHSMSDAYFIGAGVGYEWNSWLRFDATVEYRFKSRFAALGHYQPANPGPVYVDNYEGNLKSWVFLANAYVDLGTWDCFTPFVGVGVGGAWNSISDLTDTSPTVPGGGSSFGIGRGGSKFNFAWALYTGVTYNVSKSFKVDLTYRYLNYGSVSDIIDCNGGCGGTDYKMEKLYSHDFMIAFRWLCCETTPPPKYVYMPPPPPPPPPLHSKG